MTSGALLTIAGNIGNGVDPVDGTDLLGLFIIGLPASLPAVAALLVVLRGQHRGRKRWAHARAVLAGVDEKVDAVTYQVKNDYGDDSNLRDQIDDIHALVRDVSAEVRDMRGDLRVARAESHDLERRIQEFVRREHPGAGPV